MTIIGIFIIYKYLKNISFKNITSLNLVEIMDKSFLDDKHEVHSLNQGQGHGENCHFEVFCNNVRKSCC
jgi:hypothetical protein